MRYNGSASLVTVMQCGVPEGSVLGPLYFVLYTADMFRTAGELGFFIYGYADDLQIYDHYLNQSINQSVYFETRRLIKNHASTRGETRY